LSVDLREENGPGPNILTRESAKKGNAPVGRQIARANPYSIQVGVISQQQILTVHILFIGFFAGSIRITNERRQE
jgi:hypothetical protein